ncbi:MAG: hypothetical protein OQK00_07510 [Rhodobacteraceae bacterium]|nr:hypothetical protein [Paracoccaceae bacterium]
MRPLLLSIAVITLLSACKTHVSADLFTSDMVAATQGEILTTPVIFGFEVGSDCEDTGPTMLGAMKTLSEGTEFIGCAKIDYTTVAQFRAPVPVISHGETLDTALALTAQLDEGRYIIRFAVDHARVRDIWDALPEDMTKYKRFEFDPVLSATLNNDLRNATIVTTDDVFADGAPIQGTAQTSLPRRDQINLQLSDVTNSAIGSGDASAHIASFTVKD